MHSVAEAVLGSGEYAAKHESLSDTAYIDELYMGALGRHAEAGGVSAWMDALAHGVSRADVALSIAESEEAHHHNLARIEDGWHLS